MTSVPVLSLVEVRQDQARAQAREELHEQLDLWLDGLEDAVRDDFPSLEGVTKAVFADRDQLTGAIVETVVKHRHAEALEQQSMACPECGRMLQARACCSRTVETMVGKVTLKRPYFYCLRCEQGYYPLDEALELSERTKQWDVQEAAAELACETPYQTAQELFCKLTGLGVSDHTMHQVIGEVSSELRVLQVSPTASEVAQRIAEVAEGKKWRPVMVLAIDGANVPTRPEEARGPGKGRKRKRARRSHWRGKWKEAKGFRLYLVDKQRILRFRCLQSY